MKKLKKSWKKFFRRKPKLEKCSVCHTKIKGRSEVLWFEFTDAVSGTKKVIGALIHDNPWCQIGAMHLYKKHSFVGRESEIK